MQHNFHIRHATDADLPAIVELLRQSLGERSSEKSLENWRWKHIDNPFGRSPVLVAESDNQLVGVRAFMRWQWRQDRKTYYALRAVDTATHPDYRGRGIFKKLTLQLLEECRADRYDFIFNTPNDQSRPGYLKMGWQSLGRTGVRLKIQRPFRLIGSKFFGKRASDNNFPLQALDQEFDLTAAFRKIEDSSWLTAVKAQSGQLYTPSPLTYLRWRYQQCPVQQYWASGGPSHLMVFYPRWQPLGLELRLTELLIRYPEGNLTLNREFSRLSQLLQPDYISAAPKQADNLLTKKLFLPALGVGPVLTFRSLNVKPIPLKAWAYSLGDLELF